MPCFAGLAGWVAGGTGLAGLVLFSAPAVGRVPVGPSLDREGGRAQQLGSFLGDIILITCNF
jgi:hypothetical protein